MKTVNILIEAYTANAHNTDSVLVLPLVRGISITIEGTQAFFPSAESVILAIVGQLSVDSGSRLRKSAFGISVQISISKAIPIITQNKAEALAKVCTPLHAP